jgi:predicted outer membrane repeat protein/autotransporter-associated beta strand protein
MLSLLSITETYAQTAVSGSLTTAQLTTNGGNFSLSGNTSYPATTTAPANITAAFTWSLNGNGYTLSPLSNYNSHLFNLYTGGNATIYLTNTNVVGHDGDTNYGLFLNHRNDDSELHLHFEGSTFSNFVQNTSYYSAIYSSYQGYERHNTFIYGGNGADSVIYRNNASTNITHASGVMSVDNSPVTLLGRQYFFNNWAYEYGGAISVYGGGNSAFSTDVNSFLWFEGNFANRFGGAIDIWGYNATITFNGTTYFKKNYIYTTSHADVRGTRGGAVNIGNETGTVVANFNGTTTFDGNYIVNDYSTASGYRDAYGGALAAYREGAGAYYTVNLNGTNTFTNNWVYANHSSGNALGGAIYLEASGMNLTCGGNTTFQNNYAVAAGSNANGGAVYMNNGTITMDTRIGGHGPIVFIDNYAKGDGGAVFMGNSGTVELIASAGHPITFQGNKSGVSFTVSGSGSNRTVSPDTNTGIPNAIYFGSNSTFKINTIDASSAVHFYDPISSSATSGTLQKSGAGTVFFYDHPSPVKMTTDIAGGFFRLVNRAGYSVVYGAGTASNNGTITVHDAGAIVGEDGTKAQATAITVTSGGRAYVAGGTTELSAGTFSLGNDGGLGGNGTITVANAAGTPIPVATTGTFYIEATERFDPDANSADAVFHISTYLSGSGKLCKTGLGTFMAEQNNTHSGGTQIDEGTVKMTYTAAARQISDALGSGAISVNTDGLLLVRPTAGAFTINTALDAATITDSNNRGGRIDVELGATANTLTLTGNARAYNGAVRLSRLNYKMAAQGEAPELANADVIADTGSIITVPSSPTNVHGFTAGNLSVIAFDDVVTVNGNAALSSIAASQILASRLELPAGDASAEIRVQAPSGNNYDALFNADATPLLLEDDFGQLRRLIGAGANGIIVVNDASKLELKNSTGTAPVNALGTSSLLQNSIVVATRYQRMHEMSTGPNNDGLYLSARLDELKIESGKTLLLGANTVSSLPGGKVFTVPITDAGSGANAGNVSINIAATDTIMLAPHDVNGALFASGNTVRGARTGPTANATVNDGLYSWHGATTITGGVLKAGIPDMLINNTGLNIGAAGAFNVNGMPQTVHNIAGAGKVITTGAVTLTADITAAGGTEFSGAIVGNGSVVKTGTQPLKISGANMYSGNTTVISGLLDIAGTLDSAPAAGYNYAGNITNNGSIKIHGGVVQTLSGVLSGSGDISIFGAGTAVALANPDATHSINSILVTDKAALSLGNNQTIQGAGGVGLTIITVEQGARLMGTGKTGEGITGNISIARRSIIAPGFGNSAPNIGVMSVKGNIDMAGGSIAHFDVAGLTSADRLDSKGIMTITADSVSVLLTLSTTAAQQLRNNPASVNENAPIVLIKTANLVNRGGVHAPVSETWTAFGGFNFGTNTVFANGLMFDIKVRHKDGSYQIALVSCSVCSQ